MFRVLQANPILNTNLTRLKITPFSASLRLFWILWWTFNFIENMLPGVNFTNILRTAFRQKCKKDTPVKQLFCAFGICSVKAACRMLVKLTLAHDNYFSRQLAFSCIICYILATIRRIFMPFFIPSNICFLDLMS